MNKDKFIWEALGHCWHKKFMHECTKCHDWYERNPDFTTDAGKVLLLREMMGRKDWQKFHDFLTLQNWPYPMPTNMNCYIHAGYITDTTGKLRDIVCDYLMERGEIKCSTTST